MSVLFPLGVLYMCLRKKSHWAKYVTYVISTGNSKIWRKTFSEFGRKQQNFTIRSIPCLLSPHSGAPAEQCAFPPPLLGLSAGRCYRRMKDPADLGTKSSERLQGALTWILRLLWSQCSGTRSGPGCRTHYHILWFWSSFKALGHGEVLDVHWGLLMGTRADLGYMLRNQYKNIKRFHRN